MGVRASFSADFSSFLSAVKAAEVQLTKLDTGAANVQKSLNRMGDSISGTKLIKDAILMAEAVQKVGGVSTLTDKQLQQLGAQANEAAEKMRKLGLGVPENLQAITKAANDATVAAQKLPQSGVDKWMGALGTSIVSTAAGFVSAQAVIGVVTGSFRALSGFVSDSVTAYAEAEAAQKKLTTAMRAQGTALPENIAKFNDLASQFQRTTAFSDDLINSSEGLLVQIGNVMPDKMEGALKAATNLAAGLGIDLETATTLVAKAAAGHTETLGKYGITVDQAALKTQGFDAVLGAINRQFGGQAAAQLDTYAGRVTHIKDEWNNFQEVVGKAIVTNPIVEAGLRMLSERADALDKSASGASASLSEIPRSIGAKGYADAIAFFENWARAANEAAAATKRLAEIDLKPSASHLQAFAPVASHDTAAATRQAAQDAEVARRVAELSALANEHLTKTQQDQIASLAKWGESETEIAKLVHVSEQAVHLYADQLKSGTAATKKYDEAAQAVADAEAGFGDVLMSVNAFTDEHVRRLLTMGVEQGKIATALHLTDAQVRAVASSMKLQSDIVKLNTEAYIANESELRKIGVVENEEIRLLQERFKWQDRLREIETMSPKQLSTGFENVGTPAQPVPDDWLEKIAESNKRAKEFSDGIKGITEAFGLLAQIGGDSFKGIEKAIGQVVAGINVAQQAAKAFGKTLSTEAAGFIGTAIALYGAFKAFDESSWSSHVNRERIGSVLAPQVTNPDYTKDAAAIIESLRVMGLSAEQAAAKWLTLTHALIEGDDAALAAQKEIDALLHRTDRLREGAAQFGPSQKELEEMAQKSHEVFDFMQKDGGYTAESLSKAFVAFQQALADSGNEAAKVWLKTQDDATKGAAMVDKALADLRTRRESLAQSIAGEAPELVAGVVETQVRGQISALDTEIEKQSKALGLQAGDIAGEIQDRLSGIKIQPIDVPYVFRQVGPGIPTVPEGPDGAWTGGVVGQTGIQHFGGGGKVLQFFSRGTDTVPAMLTPGEMVLTAGQQKAVGALLRAGGPGGGGGNVVVHVDAKGSFFDRPGSMERLAEKVGAALMQKLHRTTRRSA